MSKRKDMQRLIRKYREETGEHELDMKRVAKWAAGKGWPLPTPPNPLDMLAKEFTDAAREEIEYDNKTGKPFRVYHALKVSHGGTQLHLFVDIEEASRDQMLVSLTMRREQMVSDGVNVVISRSRSLERSASQPKSPSRWRWTWRSISSSATMLTTKKDRLAGAARPG